MYLRFIGSLLIIIGTTSVGLYFAYIMRMRIKQLMEMKRIIINLEGEIYYRHSILKEACYNASLRSIYPFDSWLQKIHRGLDSFEEDDFIILWNKYLAELYSDSYLKRSDIEFCSSIGQSIGYLDVETQRNSIKLDKQNMDDLIRSLQKELNNKTRIAVAGGALVGIFIIMLIV